MTILTGGFKESQPQPIDLNRHNPESDGQSFGFSVYQRPKIRQQSGCSYSTVVQQTSPQSQIAVTNGGCIGSSSSNSKKPNFNRNRNGDRNEYCNRNGDADFQT
ncbi:hypothetical protein Hanom_Chr00s000001g01592621 [Helianthus anomalus]